MVYGESAGLSYGFVNLSDIEIIANSPLSINFYWDNPYVVPSGHSVSGGLNWFFNLDDIDGIRAKRIIQQYNNFSYIMEGRYRYPLLDSVHRKKDNVYNSGTIKIWMLGK